LAEIPFEGNSDGFDFDTEIIIQLHDKRMRIKEIPIPTYYGDEICYVKGLPYAKDVLADVMRYRMSKAGAATPTSRTTVAKPGQPAKEYTLKHSPWSSHGRILSWLSGRSPRTTAGTWTLTVASCTLDGNSGNCKASSITTLATSTFYIDTATVATYSNSACTTSASSFNAGTTIYAGGTETGGSFNVNFVNPSSTTAASDSVATSGSYCVSYAVPSNAPTGTWTVTVTESSDSVAEPIQTSTPTFTLNGAVPDIPFGVLPLVLIVPALYLVMRRSLGHS
jgi:hypothetical protein